MIKPIQGHDRFRWWVALSVSLAILLGSTGVARAGTNRGSPGSAAATSRKQTDAYETTVRYVAQFYPLVFTYQQAKTYNRFIGPEKVTSLYHAVVAINVDTIYASTVLNLTDQPVIVKVPATAVSYSILQLDPYGNIFQTNLAPTSSGGTYALYGPGFTGTLPAGVIPVAEPYNYSNLLFRADKASSTGQDTSSEAAQFRQGLFTQPLCAYLQQSCPAGTPPGGFTQILPQGSGFAFPVKSFIDGLADKHQFIFLKLLQTAVHAPNTPPLSRAQQALSSRFDRLFRHLRPNSSGLRAGVRAAHALIINTYLTHTGPTNWVHFNNIGNWGKQVVQRAAITEFCQYCNSISTAGYWHAFKDGQGKPLNGSNSRGYVLTFRKGQLPVAKRFWSVTAYTPQAIELIPNRAQKYNVASYTPGLHYNPDGSLTIHISRTQPRGVPMANWLPVWRSKFNLMLRIYGTTDSSGTYVPPAITELR
jgi:hypothetical protein